MAWAKIALFILLATSVAAQDLSKDKLIKQLAGGTFAHCDLYLVDSNWFPLDSKQFSSAFLTTQIKDSVATRGVYVFTITMNTPHIGGDATNHKFAPQCSFVLIELKSNWSRDFVLSSKLTKLLTPTYSAITHKDEDHYAILTTRTLVDSVLNLEFIRELKFKLVLYEDKDSLEVLSVCFYCDNGNPQVVNVQADAFKFLQLKISSWEGRDLLFKDYTKNAQGHELQVSATTRLVFTIAIAKSGDRWYVQRGFSKDVIDGITTAFNYTYRVYPANSNGGSGAILPNGTWIGTVRDIIDGKCDIGVVAALNHARYKLIGGNTFFYAWVNFIMGKPKRIYGWQTVIWPFNLTLWLALCTALSIVLMSFKLLPLREVSDSKPLESFRRHYILFTLAPLLEQDFEYPSASPTRVLCAIWLIANVILTTAYRSKLFVQMTFPKMEVPPQTFEELAGSDFKWGLEAAAIDGAAHQHFATSTNPTNRKLYSQMSLQPDSNYCVTQGLHKKFACITWNGQGEYIIHRNFTDRLSRNPFTMSEDLSALVGAGFVYKKRALFRANFDRLVDSIREMGVVDKFKVMDFERGRLDHLQYVKEHPEAKQVDSDEGPEVLTLRNLKGPFYILLALNLCSLLCFICEFFLVMVKVLNARQRNKLVFLNI